MSDRLATSPVPLTRLGLSRPLRSLATLPRLSQRPRPEKRLRGLAGHHSPPSRPFLRLSSPDPLHLPFSRLYSPLRLSSLLSLLRLQASMLSRLAPEDLLADLLSLSKHLRLLRTRLLTTAIDKYSVTQFCLTRKLLRLRLRSSKADSSELCL